jgi:hypothetical protein
MSSEDKIKELRHSFTKSVREELETPVKNQFGHTVLNPNDSNVDLSKMNLSIGETGEPRADLKTSIFESEQFQDWLKSSGKVPQIEDSEPEMIQESIDPRKQLISSLMSELDDLDIEIKPQHSTMRIIKKPEVDKQNNKDCSNPECLYALPIDAKFCLKCGTPQLKKFCTECGFHFKTEEKFCPDCGTKR